MGDSSPLRLFNRMTDSFSRNVREGKKWRRRYLALSAGVCWMPPPDAVKELLWHELTGDVTTRNYGNPGGIAQPVAALAAIERRQYAHRGLEVTITHGTTEGAFLLLDLWVRSGVMHMGDSLMTIGHAFGLYDRLAEDFGLYYRQLLGAPDCMDSFLPDADRIAEALERERPTLIVVLLPQNPLGEFISDAGLEEICRYAERARARILVDRVCLMPWDSCDGIARLLGPLIASGHAAVVDSLSKSHSIAGLRTGFAVTNAPTKAALVELNKSRFLNPPVFPLATMAAVRLAEADLRLGVRMGRLFRKAADEIFSEYPGNEDFHAFLDRAIALLPDLKTGMEERRQTLQHNYQTLGTMFGDTLARPLIWDGGFNVALSTVDMDPAREIEDAEALACDHGLGVLTSRCFCDADGHDRYFIRVGLTLPCADFDEAMSRLSSFYARRRQEE